MERFLLVNRRFPCREGYSRHEGSHGLVAVHFRVSGLDSMLEPTGEEGGVAHT